jgi:nucleoside-diphosphate-sugar epimerase
VSRDGATLVTGALGCLGAWVCALLARDGERVVAHDLGTDARRLDLVARPGDLEQVTVVQGDITDFEALRALLREHEVQRVVHLAALQVPYCAADPVSGARVNVVGTACVLQAAREAGLRSPVAFASSIAAAAEPGAHPGTLYGVYKLADEGIAVRYWEDYGLASIGLRPACVYGPGRDRGTTAAVSEAIVAAARGQAYNIPFCTALELNYVEDVARAFIAASRSAPDCASVFAVRSDGAVGMTDLVAAVERVVPGAAALISVGSEELPFPGATPGTPFANPVTALEDGIRATVELTRR